MFLCETLNLYVPARIESERIKIIAINVSTRQINKKKFPEEVLAEIKIVFKRVLEL